ncbi:MAG: helix-turn-helix domain-containing protein [Candidatus Dormiibacterota bacterium]
MSDAQTMRALSHPVRQALIETLTLDGPLTATQASERIGESPTTCSFHLR